MKANQTSKSHALTKLILEIFSLNGNLLTTGDALTIDLGITSSQWQVLGALEPGAKSISQIGRIMGLTRQSVRRTVHILKDAGLVKFIENPDHKRSPLIKHTSAGQAILKQVTARQIKWANQLGKKLTLAEIKKANETLQKLNQMLNQHANI